MLFEPPVHQVKFGFVRFLFLLVFLFGFSSLYAQENPYLPVQQVGQACLESFPSNDVYSRYLVQQVFVLEPKNQPWMDKAKPLPWKSNFSYEDKQAVAQQSTQIYLNQLFYNWMSFEETYGRSARFVEKLGTKLQTGMTSLPPVKTAVTKAQSVFDTEIGNIRQITAPDEIQNEIDMVNLLIDGGEVTTIENGYKTTHIDGINQICQARHKTYSKLKALYLSKTNLNYSIAESGMSADVEKLLYPNGRPSNPVQVGGLDGLIRKRMQEERELGAYEAGVYWSIVSRSKLGNLLNTKTDLQKEVGSFDSYACVESGRQLKRILFQDLIYPSVKDAEENFKSTATRLAYPTEAPEAILKGFIQENPQTVMSALASTSDVQQAKLACSLIHEIKNSQERKAIFAPIVIIAGTILTAAAGPEMAPIASAGFNMLIVGAMTIDLIHSYTMEKHVEGAILAGQIQPLQANEIIRNLKNERALSYINLTLAGIGATVSIKQMMKMDAQIKSFNDKLDAQSGVTKTKFNQINKTNEVPAKVNKNQTAQTTFIENPNTKTTLSTAEVDALKKWINSSEISGETIVSPKTTTTNTANIKTTKSNDPLSTFYDDLANDGIATLPKTKGPDLGPGSTTTIQTTTQNKITTNSVTPDIKLNSSFVQNQVILSPLKSNALSPNTTNVTNILPIIPLNAQNLFNSGTEPSILEISREFDLDGYDALVVRLNSIANKDKKEKLSEEDKKLLCRLFENADNFASKELLKVLSILWEKFKDQLDCKNSSPTQTLEQNTQVEPTTSRDPDDFDNPTVPKDNPSSNEKQEIDKVIPITQYINGGLTYFTPQQLNSQPSTRLSPRTGLNSPIAQERDGDQGLSFSNYYWMVFQFLDEILNQTEPLTQEQNDKICDFIKNKHKIHNHEVLEKLSEVEFKYNGKLNCGDTNQKQIPPEQHTTTTGFIDDGSPYNVNMREYPTAEEAFWQKFWEGVPPPTLNSIHHRRAHAPYALRAPQFGDVVEYYNEDKTLELIKRLIAENQTDPKYFGYDLCELARRGNGEAFVLAQSLGIKCSDYQLRDVYIDQSDREYATTSASLDPPNKSSLTPNENEDDPLIEIEFDHNVKTIPTSVLYTDVTAIENLPIRAKTQLLGADNYPIRFLGELIEVDPNTFHELRNVGDKTANSINIALSAYDAQMGGKIRDSSIRVKMMEDKKRLQEVLNGRGTLTLEDMVYFKSQICSVAKNGIGAFKITAMAIVQSHNFLCEDTGEAHQENLQSRTLDVQEIEPFLSQDPNRNLKLIDIFQNEKACTYEIANDFKTELCSISLFGTGETKSIAQKFVNVYKINCSGVNSSSWGLQTLEFIKQSIQTQGKIQYDHFDEALHAYQKIVQAGDMKQNEIDFFNMLNSENSSDKLYRIRNFVYMLDEIYTYQQKYPNRITQQVSYLREFYKTKSDDIHSPLDDRNFIRNKQEIRFFPKMSLEDTLELKENLKKNPTIQFSSRSSRKYTLTFGKDISRVTLVVEMENARIDDSTILVNYQYTIDWNTTPQISVDGEVWLRVVDEFGNPALIYFIHPKYNRTDSQLFFKDNFMHDQFYQLTDLIKKTSSQMAAINPKHNYEFYNDFLWKNIYTAYDMGKFGFITKIAWDQNDEKQSLMLSSIDAILEKIDLILEGNASSLSNEFIDALVQLRFFLSTEALQDDLNLSVISFIENLPNSANNNVVFKPLFLHKVRYWLPQYNGSIVWSYDDQKKFQDIFDSVKKTNPAKLEHLLRILSFESSPIEISNTIRQFLQTNGKIVQSNTDTNLLLKMQEMYKKAAFPDVEEILQLQKVMKKITDISATLQVSPILNRMNDDLYIQALPDSTFRISKKIPYVEDYVINLTQAKRVNDLYIIPGIEQSTAKLAYFELNPIAANISLVSAPKEAYMNDFESPLYLNLHKTMIVVMDDKSSEKFTAFEATVAHDYMDPLLYFGDPNWFQNKHVYILLDAPVTQVKDPKDPAGMEYWLLHENSNFQMIESFEGYNGTIFHFLSYITPLHNN